MKPEGYSPSEMKRFRHLIGIGKRTTTTIKPLASVLMGEDWKLKSRAQKSVHAVEDSIGIWGVSTWEWDDEIKCYHIYYPSEFNCNPLSVSYYGDGQISYSRGDDINVISIDNWYLTTLRKHLREFYPYKPVTSS